MFMPRAVGQIVDKVARQTVGKDWAIYAGLLSHWAEIAGLEYAQVSTPVKITFPHQPQQAQRKGGTLYIRLPKGLTMEFSFKTDQIIQRVNGYFGYAAIARVAFEADYKARKPAKAPLAEPDAASLAALEIEIKPIENNALHDALAGLGKAMLADLGRQKVKRPV